jgi:hypothetical protein
MAAAADDVEFRAALARIGWNNEAAMALIGEGFTTMSDITTVMQEFLELGTDPSLKRPASAGR